MPYVKVAQVSDLEPEHKAKISYEEREILLTKIGDQYYAVDNKCPHMGGSLYQGTLTDNRIACPKHGTAFDVRTGKLVAEGKFLFVKIKTGDLRSYPVKVEGSDIFIDVV